MILLHLLPDSLLASIVHAMVIIGLLGTILGYFLNYIPGIVQYRIPIKVISTLLFLSGIYFEGGYSNEMKWRDRVREVEAKLKPVQIALEKAIDEDPNILGKTKLGQDYEGIVINTRLGPVKVTSERQKDIIAKKNAARAAARADHGDRAGLHRDGVAV